MRVSACMGWMMVVEDEPYLTTRMDSVGHFGKWRIRCSRVMSRGTGLQDVLRLSWSQLGAGANENVNGLIRPYFPKGSNPDQVMDKEIAEVERKLNRYSRECLGCQIPVEVFCDGVQWQVKTSCLAGVALIA